MRLHYSFALLALLAAPAGAQTAPIALPGPPVPATAPPEPAPPAEPRWRTQGKSGLNLNEATLSSNWRGGGANTLGLSALADVKANRKSGIHSFDNEADLLFAFSQTAGLGYRKTQDRLYLDTKYGRAISPNWDTFLSLNLLSQFAPGYRYDTGPTGNPLARQVSDFFAPAYITAAYGFEYHPNPAFHVRLAPFAPRLTVVNRVERFVEAIGPAPFGVNPGHSTRWELLAAQILAELDQNLGANVNLKARYLLFANYETLEFRRLNHRLDLTLTAKVNRFVNVSLTGTALYNYDQDSALQYSQGLTLGVAYAFQNFADPLKK